MSKWDIFFSIAGAIWIFGLVYYWMSFSKSYRRLQKIECALQEELERAKNGDINL